MVPSIKIIDKRPGEQHRHNKVYQILGKRGVCAKKVHHGKGAFFVITSDDAVETILNYDSKETFSQEGFEVIPPIEYNSMKTIVVKHLDYMIDSFTDDDVIFSIERLNDWAQVESIYRIPSTSKILKIRFKTQQMTQVALDKGIKILHQYIPKWNIEKELFIRLTPCRNFYKYDHRLKDCKVEQKLRCTFCAGEHRQNECKEKSPKCINCGGQHRTLAAACKVCKDLIKEKSGEIRDQMRSQSNQQQYATYANAATASKGNTAMGGMGTGAGMPGLTKTETKEMITTIMSAIVYSHYVEAIDPGSFQSNMTDIYKRNGLKPVNFPTPPMTDTVLQSCREVFFGTQDTNSEDKTDEQTNDNASSNQTDEDELTLRMVDDDVVTETTPMKRQRESLTPPNKDEKWKKEYGIENLETNLSIKKTSCNNEGLPQRRSGVGDARHRSNSRSKDKREKPRSDSPSTSSQVQVDKRTKSLGLKMYMKKIIKF